MAERTGRRVMARELIPRPLPVKAQLHLAYEDSAKLRARNATLSAENERLRKALKPFAAVAEHDIGDDETDDDIFWPMSNARYSMAGRLRVGHLRTARRALEGGENG